MSSDADEMLRLVRTFHAKAKPPYAVEATLAEMVKPGCYLWVAEGREGLVGYVWVTVKGPREAFVEQIYADEAITDGFESALIPILRDAGFVVVTTVAIREGWIKMFKRWGFRPVGVHLERTIAPREMQRLPLLDEEPQD